MKVLLCDLDGSLVSSLGLHDKAWQKLFAQYGITLSEAEIKEHVGMKNVIFIGRVLERRGRNDLDPQLLSNQKDDMVVAVLEEEPAIVYPHAKEMLRLLSANGITLVLATSATRRTALVLGKEVMEYFHAAVFAEDVSHGKPDPEIFLTAAARSGAELSECAVLEDAENGVQAAKAGGFACIARDNGFGQDLSAADLVVTEYDPQAILAYLKSRP